MSTCRATMRLAIAPRNWSRTTPSTARRGARASANEGPLAPAGASGAGRGRAAATARRRRERRERPPSELRHRLADSARDLVRSTQSLISRRRRGCRSSSGGRRRGTREQRASARPSEAPRRTTAINAGQSPGRQPEDRDLDRPSQLTLLGRRVASASPGPHEAPRTASSKRRAPRALQAGPRPVRPRGTRSTGRLPRASAGRAREPLATFDDRREVVGRQSGPAFEAKAQWPYGKSSSVSLMPPGKSSSSPGPGSSVAFSGPMPSSRSPQRDPVRLAAPAAVDDPVVERQDRAERGDGGGASASSKRARNGTRRRRSRARRDASARPREPARERVALVLRSSWSRCRAASRGSRRRPTGSACASTPICAGGLEHDPRGRRRVPGCVGDSEWHGAQRCSTIAWTLREAGRRPPRRSTRLPPGGSAARARAIAAAAVARIHQAFRPGGGG